MARTSRKNLSIEEKPLRTAGIDFFRTALYERLSVEDNGKKDADSLENQDRLLRDYVIQRPFLEFAEVYVDNGHTGTNFDRPAFKKMMKDIQHGKIDCVIVKDFSRLGRNYIDAGNYVENIFPFFGVRFISVGDKYDSATVTANDRLSLSLKNVINDIYAKDISKKLCSTMKQKREHGEYIGNYAPYGYLKDPLNHNHLIVDLEIAPIVVEIFETRANGMGYSSICRMLNDKDYPSPGRLRYERGIITNNNKQGKNLLWNLHVLKDLLSNVVYIGNLAQGRSAQCLYKGEKFHWTDSSEWDLVENTHEAIVSIELWDKVQEINNAALIAAKKSHGKYANLKKRENPYQSVLKCADCGRVIKQVRTYSKPRKDGVVKDYYHYKCPKNIELGESACSKKNIQADKLDKAVLESIKAQMDLFLDMRKTLDYLLSLEQQRDDWGKINSRISELESAIASKKKLISSLYTDFKDGMFTLNEYVANKAKYQEDISMLEIELNELYKIKAKTKKLDMGKKQWTKMIKRYYDVKVVTVELVSALVDEILLNSDNTIIVKFKFMNEFEELMAECERIRQEVA